jgi:hypothetical protein
MGLLRIAAGLFTESFPSNGSTCHNMYTDLNVSLAVPTNIGLWNPATLIGSHFSVPEHFRAEDGATLQLEYTVQLLLTDKATLEPLRFKLLASQSYC